ncbi:DNA primase/helicase, phage-associated [Acidisarcina polymorpha]|uniref:DNA primase/helicase, phage-associated n=1 Tax=Acidisarcina polymorpha TaxID=2211140 RepID=A0A2Z5G9Q2_9BACT|nr:phage/plasmid primase, P4 family [Acidisarcina polymorpha]AXC15749.1 DNA primase/helicase, phage-associated [Acidisarcina polymorpha]
MPKRKSKSDQKSSSRPESSPASISSFAMTDSGNGEWIGELYNRRLCFDHRRGKWLFFKENRWIEDSNGEIYRVAKAAARKRLALAADLQEEKERNEQAEWARKSESRYLIDAALTMARSTETLADSGEGWDASATLIGVRNGVVDLQSGRVRAGCPEDRLTLQTSAAFDPSAQCPRFETFLNDVFCGDDELIRYVQKAIGYSLTGEVGEQCLFLCFGDGANGKSTLLETIRHILGSYAYNVPFSTFELKARSGIPNDVAALVGKRFVTAAETNEGATFNEARVKTLTGGDNITARFLYKENFTFQPVAKVWLAFNHKPEVIDESHGFWRRIRLIPFHAQFDGARRDPELPSKLREEASGILAWAVRGCLLWRKEGLVQPTCVTEATKAYREESNPVSAFLEDTYEVKPGGFVPSALLRTGYERWCHENGEKPLDARALASRLLARGFTQDRQGHGRTRGWKGLRPKAEHLSDAQKPADMRTGADALVQ